MRYLLCLMMLTMTAWCADVTGKWNGTADLVSPDGDTHQYVIELQLRQSGSGLSGTISAGPGQEGPIENGKVDGETVTFEVQQGNSGPLWKVKLTPSGH